MDNQIRDCLNYLSQGRCVGNGDALENYYTVAEQFPAPIRSFALGAIGKPHLICVRNRCPVNSELVPLSAMKTGCGRLVEVPIDAEI